MSYAWGQLGVAMTALSGGESQRARLIGAYTCLISLKRKDLPAETHTTFDALLKSMEPYSLRSVQQK
jgi:aspartyl aminopeptidase